MYHLLMIVEILNKVDTVNCWHRAGRVYLHTYIIYDDSQIIPVAVITVTAGKEDNCDK